MKLKKLLWVFAVLLLFVGVRPSVYASFEGDMYQTLSDFVQNPRMFFMDIQYDIEDTYPVWTEDLQVHTNLFMQLLGIANLGVKGRVYGDGKDFPRITVGMDGWYFWSLTLLTEIDDLKKAKDIRVFGAVPFFVVSQSFNPTVDLFFGSKLSIGHVEMDFRQVVAEQVSDDTLKDLLEKVSYIKETYVDPAFFLGMGIKTGEHSRLAVQVGYQLGEKRIFAKIVTSGENWEFGLGFYPDSIFIVHPVINLHYRFDI